MNIFSLFYYWAVKISTQRWRMMLFKQKKQEVVNKVDQGELIHDQYWMDVDFAKEKVLKGEIKSSKMAYIFIMFTDEKICL